MRNFMKNVATDDPEEMAKARVNMQRFLEDLFREISRTKGELMAQQRMDAAFKGMPSDMMQTFKKAGILDRLPTGGFAPDGLEGLQLWTEEECEVFAEDPESVPLLEEDEEIRRELLRLSAVRKLEKFFSEYPDDPAEVLNMMIAAKLAMEAKRSPLNPYDLGIDDVTDAIDEDMEPFIDVDGLEECLKALEEGEDAPPPDPEQYTVIPSDPPEVFGQRMQLMRDFYADSFESKRDRVLSKAEYNAIQQRWDAFMPDEDPLLFQDISHIRLPPEWPDWMERHFRALQHMTYILRAAHIHACITEPLKRLRRYNRISIDVTYTDPAIQLEGFEAVLEHMEKLRAAGLTTEPNMIFGDCQPPEEKLPDPEIENPWSFTIVVDQHLNIPIPNWYHAELDAFEATLQEEDLIQKEDPVGDREAYELTESMDRILRETEGGKQPNPKGYKKQRRKRKPPHPSEVPTDEMKARLDALGVGIKDGDPAVYEPIYPPELPPARQKKDYSGSGKVKGDFWYEGRRCEAWKDGHFITINATLLYTLDIQAGQVREIRMRWGAILGSLLEPEDAEKIFCKVSDVPFDRRRTKESFTSEWKAYEYKPIRKDPLKWFQENVMGL